MTDHNHSCQNGCGNIADVVVVNLDDNQADIVCMPCFLRLANDISRQFMENMTEQRAVAVITEDLMFAIQEDVNEYTETRHAVESVQDGTAMDLDTTPVPVNPDLPEAFR